MKLLQFQKHLEKEQIDLTILIHPDINITYFTQIKPSFALLLIKQNSTELHLTKLDKKPNLKLISTKILKTNWEKNITNKKIKSIGINKETLTLKFLEKIKKIYPNAKLIDISTKLKELRAQKTPSEIKKITKACKITTNAFNHLTNNFNKNKLKTEQDIAYFLEKYIREQGAELSFPTIVASNKNSSIPHHLTSNQKLTKGPLLLDFGACYQNYCSDMSRVLFIGKPTKIQKEKYTLLLKTQTSTINQIKNNHNCCNLDKHCRKQLGKCSSHFIHSLGHGLGLEIHEPPKIRPESKNILKSNQIFTIEPGIYFPNKFGLRIEDTILFLKKPKILTKALKEPIIL